MTLKHGSCGTVEWFQQYQCCQTRRHREKRTRLHVHHDPSLQPLCAGGRGIVILVILTIAMAADWFYSMPHSPRITRTHGCRSLTCSEYLSDRNVLRCIYLANDTHSPGLENTSVTPTPSSISPSAHSWKRSCIGCHISFPSSGWWLMCLTTLILTPVKLGGWGCKKHYPPMTDLIPQPLLIILSIKLVIVLTVQPSRHACRDTFLYTWFLIYMYHLWLEAWCTFNFQHHVVRVIVSVILCHILVIFANIQNLSFIVKTKCINSEK